MNRQAKMYLLEYAKCADLNYPKLRIIPIKGYFFIPTEYMKYKQRRINVDDVTPTLIRGWINDMMLQWL